MGSQNIKTPQEHELLGGTPPIMPKTRGEWFVPHAVTAGTLGIDEVIRERQETGYIGSMLLDLLLKPEQGNTIKIKLPDIDPKTGEALHDPHIFEGEWDDDANLFRTSIDITDRALEALQHEGAEVHLKNEPKITKEGKSGGGLEIG